MLLLLSYILLTKQVVSTVNVVKGLHENMRRGNNSKTRTRLNLTGPPAAASAHQGKEVQGGTAGLRASRAPPAPMLTNEAEDNQARPPTENQACNPFATALRPAGSAGAPSPPPSYSTEDVTLPEKCR